MKASQSVVLLLAGLIVGLCVGGNITGPSANAQGIPNAVAPSVPRFQITSWTSGTGTHGCYIIDTTTGQLWSCDGSGRPAKISDKLP